MNLIKQNSDTAKEKAQPFFDLTPVNNADPDKTYAKALSFAIDNPSIKNIALSGPYCSGKSSIIKTYFEQCKYKFLNISLASFKDCDAQSVELPLIERSILQQMLYGADSSNLPYSRFKKISPPHLTLFKSLIFVLWGVTGASLILFQDEWVNFALYSCRWWFVYFLLVFVISFSIVIIAIVYESTYGFSLKKLSLKNGEIETGEVPETSILNRHLDEIIYFFQATDYKVVVLEDLDRFGNTEIFVKLREINKLINDNGKTRGTIKFLYAIKDDMFAHNNRAKFFDFIIPVIPIINSSNSLDKMQERLREHDFAKKIDSQFLREVSLYINDLRLIHNIFNELVIYFERLKSERLDVTKLLAMMIYKNMYPKDFESLHLGQGVFFEICKKRSEYLLMSKANLKKDNEKLKNSLKLAETEKARNIQELIELYVGHIVVKYSGNHVVYGIYVNNREVSLSNLQNFNNFEPLIKENSISLVCGNPHRIRIDTKKSFSQIEEEINPGLTFLSRKKNLDNNSELKRAELQDEISRNESKLSELSQFKLFQLIKNCDLEIEKLLDDDKTIDWHLLLYLVKNGYLDEYYHLYMSNFHEGRLTKNDRDFLLTIRNFNLPNPLQIIDTPEEVCKNMREEDFEHKYILNVNLIDYLLSTEKGDSSRVKSAMKYISRNYKHCDEFFSGYFKEGQHLKEFICTLSMEWPGFALSTFSSNMCSENISYILKFVDSDYVSEKMNDDNLLTDYISQKGHLILASDIPFLSDYSVLEKLSVRFNNLALLEKNDVLITFAAQKCLYTITIENVNYILRKFGTQKNVSLIQPENANYTSILAAGHESLKEYIEDNISDYIEKVFLSLPQNSEETEATIKVLINHNILDIEQKRKIVSKENYVFKSFDGVSEALWSHLLLEEKVIISWENISEYLRNENSDEAVVTELLNRPKNINLLSTSNLSKAALDEENKKSLALFIFNNNGINDSAYYKLINSLSYRFLEFPEELSSGKIEFLAMQGVVKLTEKSFNFVKNDNKLVSILISRNFKDYDKDKEKYPISDDVRELLLSSTIEGQYKITIIHDIEPQNVIKSKKMASLIADSLLLNNDDCSKIDTTVLTSAIINAQTNLSSIELLMRCLPFWDEKKAMEVITLLPDPYKEISSYGRRPRLEKNEINLKFAQVLKERGFISSITDEEGFIKINTFKSNDHSEI